MTDWSEIHEASEDGRHELHLNGDVISTRLEANKGELPESLFKLCALNYLEISDTSLAKIGDSVKNLSNMINLALHRNKLSSISSSIDCLPKLKFLDLSYNELKSLPDGLCLPTVHTCNFSNNQLEEVPDFSGWAALSILFIDHNNITTFPAGVDTLAGFHDLNASNNLIKELPAEIKTMQAMKDLNLSENKLQTVVMELSECRKLKNLDLKNNPLKDNRLKKMTVQCSTKAILDYLAKQGSSGGGKKKGKGKGASAAKVENKEDGKKVFILQDKEDERRVVSANSVKDLRPYICCCVIKKLDLTDQSKFKSFLTMQTKLHENECDMRTKATIATHKLSELSFPLLYAASPTTDIRIKALGKEKGTSAAQLLESMKKERETLKQKKKRNVKTGLFKFLDLVEGQESLACLKNSGGEVISLPPMTNSEVTKISDDAIDVFIEVTSPMSLPQCKHIMEELLKGMVMHDFKSKDDDMDGLIIEPIRVCDDKGDLRALYPSKIDLVDLKGINVERIEQKGR